MMTPADAYRASLAAQHPDRHAPEECPCREGHVVNARPIAEYYLPPIFMPAPHPSTVEALNSICVRCHSGNTHKPRCCDRRRSPTTPLPPEVEAACAATVRQALRERRMADEADAIPWVGTASSQGDPMTCHNCKTNTSGRCSIHTARNEIAYVALARHDFDAPSGIAATTACEHGRALSTCAGCLYAALAEREAEVARLREALTYVERKLVDPEIEAEISDAWQRANATLAAASPLATLDAALAQARAEEREECARIAEGESEPGEPTAKEAAEIAHADLCEAAPPEEKP